MNWGRLEAAEVAAEEEAAQVVVVAVEVEEEEEEEEEEGEEAGQVVVAAELLVAAAMAASVTLPLLLQRETMRPTYQVIPDQSITPIHLMNALMGVKMRWKMLIGRVIRVQEHGHEGVEGGVGWR